MVSGVYSIRCKLDGRLYIGAAKKLNIRFNGHRSDMRRGRHHSTMMQDVWDRHGSSAFEFRVLVVCDLDYAQDVETKLIEMLRPAFNTTRRLKDHTGVRRSRETRDRQAAARRKAWETRPRPTYDVGDGRLLTKHEIEAEFGVKPSTLRYRRGCGMTGVSLVAPDRRFHPRPRDGV